MLHSPALLTIGLDADTLAKLEAAAALELLSLEDYIRDLFARHLRSDDKDKSVRKVKGARAAQRSAVPRAPLDAFLPDGVDPFLRDEAAQALAQFEQMQTRLRFAGSAAVPCPEAPASSDERP